MQEEDDATVTDEAGSGVVQQQVHSLDWDGWRQVTCFFSTAPTSGVYSRLRLLLHAGWLLRYKEEDGCNKQRNKKTTCGWGTEISIAKNKAQ